MFIVFRFQSSQGEVVIGAAGCDDAAKGATEPLWLPESFDDFDQVQWKSGRSRARSNTIVHYER